MNPNEPFRPGLEDVVVAETALSLVIPRALFTPVFAAGRSAGWLALAEERAVGRLIRPRQRYVGPLPAAFDGEPLLLAVG